VQQQKMMHKQFPAWEFTRVNAKGTCHEPASTSLRVCAAMWNSPYRNSSLVLGGECRSASAPHSLPRSWQCKNLPEWDPHVLVASGKQDAQLSQRDRAAGCVI